MRAGRSGKTADLVPRGLSVLFILIVWLGMLPVPAGAQELRIARSSLAVTADPHVFINTGSRELAAHLYETLTVADHQLNVLPGLAVAWTRTSPRRWQFRLRSGPLSAGARALTGRDVLFSLCRIMNYPGKAAQTRVDVEILSGVRERGPDLIELETRVAQPRLPMRLSRLAVMQAPPDWTGRFQDGACDGPFAYGRDALEAAGLDVGTGPYRLESFAPDRIALVRQPTAATINSPWERVTLLREAPEAAARGLIAGRLDVITGLSDSMMQHLAGIAGLRTVDGYPSSLFYLQFNQAEHSAFLPAGIANPLRDARVRQALSLAIDREMLASRPKFQPGRATLQAAAPESPDHVDALPVPPRDLDKAKALLKAAGYGDGFAIDFMVIPDTEWLTDPMTQMWKPLGVEAVRRDVGTRYSEEQEKAAFAINLAGTAVDQTDPTAFLRAKLATRGAGPEFGSRNQVGYSDPELDRMLLDLRDAAGGRQQELKIRIARRVAETAAIVPLIFASPRWHLRPGLSMQARVDNRVLAWDVRPVEAPPPP